MIKKDIKATVSSYLFKMIEAVLCENCVEVRRLKERKEADCREIKKHLDNSLQTELFFSLAETVDEQIIYKTINFFVAGIKKSETNIFIPDREEIRLQNAIDNKKSEFLRNAVIPFDVYNRWEAICSKYEREISKDAYIMCDKIISFVFDLYK